MFQSELGGNLKNFDFQGIKIDCIILQKVQKHMKSGLFEERLKKRFFSSKFEKKISKCLYNLNE